MRASKYRLLIIAFAIGIVSCTAIPPSEINELYKDVIYQREAQYRIKPGDGFTISFFGSPEYTQSLFVLPDGRTDPFFMDDAIVAGQTIKELQENVKQFYAQQIREPEISLQIEPDHEAVYLHGAVITPGPQQMTLKMTLSQLLIAGGGYADTASIDDVILRRPYRNQRQPDVFRISLYDDSEELFLLPNDQIIVDRTYWIVFRDYLREYIWGILPFDPRFLVGQAAL